MTSKLKRKSAIGYAWNLGGTIAQQGSGFIISIFLARLLSPAEFGLIGMAMVFINISQVFIDVGFSSALIQNKDNSNLTYSSVFYFNLFAGLLLTALFYFSASLIGDFFDNTQITDLVRWLSLIFVFNSLNLVQKAILIKSINFKILTLRSVLASTIGGILGVICAFQGLGVYSLVIHQLASAFVGTILLWNTSEWKPDFKFSMIELKKLTEFSSFVFFDRFLSVIFRRLDVLFIGKVFSPATLGFYTRAVSLKDQVTTYSSASLTKVFFPVLSSLKDNDKEYNRIYFKVLSVISFLSYGLAGILYVIGEDIIILLFGPKWGPSIPIFQILILSVSNYPLNSMMVNAFMSKGKSKENFAVGIVRKIVRIIPLIFAYFYGIFEFTVAVLITSYILTIINIFFLKKHVSLSRKKHFQKIFEGILPLILIIFVFQLEILNGTLNHFLLALAFIVLYVLYNYLLRIEGFNFIIDNANPAFKKFKKKIAK